MNLVIAFLLAVTALIGYSDIYIEEVFKLLVTVASIKGNCGEVKITVAYKSETFDLCEGDERPFEQQRRDPITSQGYQLEFPT